MLATNADCSQLHPWAVMATRQLEKIIKHHDEQAFTKYSAVVRAVHALFYLILIIAQRGKYEIQVGP